MPVLTKRRRAEMEGTVEGRAELEAEANLQLPTVKRRRTISPKRDTQRIEQSTQQTPTNHPIASPDEALLDEQAEVDAQLQTEVDAYYRRVSSMKPAEHESVVDTSSASSASNLRPTKETPSNQAPTKAKPQAIVEETSEDEGTETSTSTSDRKFIGMTKLLLEHAHKYGVTALPSQEALQSWLNENKDEFVKHSSGRMVDDSVSLLTPCRGSVLDDTLTEIPLTALKPGENPMCPPEMVDTHQTEHLRRARRCGSGAIHCVRCAAASILRRVAMFLEPNSLNQQQGRRVRDAFIPSFTRTLPAATSRTAEQCLKVVAPKEDVHTHTSLSTKAAGKQPARLGQQLPPPPLDPRFFYPDGSLRATYRHREAQVPLPRQWVSWAIENGHHEVPGRGDIRDPGTAMADETFDYDALHMALHRLLYRPSHSKVYPSARAGEELLTDDRPAAAAFHHFSLQGLPVSQQHHPIEDSQPHGLNKGTGSEAASTLEAALVSGIEHHQAPGAGPVLGGEMDCHSISLSPLKTATNLTASVQPPKKSVRFAVDSGLGSDYCSANHGGPAAWTATSRPSSFPARTPQERRSGAPSPEVSPTLDIADAADEALGT
ncbi:hypothetical protein Hte_003388 [Hypoxylon texense]